MMLSIYLGIAFLWFLWCFSTGVEMVFAEDMHVSDKKAFKVAFYFLISILLAVVWPLSFSAAAILGLRARRLRKEAEGK